MTGEFRERLPAAQKRSPPSSLLFKTIRAGSGSSGKTAGPIAPQSLTKSIEDGSEFQEQLPRHPLGDLPIGVFGELPPQGRRPAREGKYSRNFRI